MGAFKTNIQLHFLMVASSVAILVLVGLATAFPEKTRLLRPDNLRAPGVSKSDTKRQAEPLTASITRTAEAEIQNIDTIKSQPGRGGQSGLPEASTKESKFYLSVKKTAAKNGLTSNQANLLIQKLDEIEKYRASIAGKPLKLSTVLLQKKSEEWAAWAKAYGIPPKLLQIDTRE